MASPRTVVIFVQPPAGRRHILRGGSTAPRGALRRPPVRYLEQSMSSKSPARGIPLHRASPLNWLLKDYGYSSWRSGVEMAGMPR